MKTLLFSGCLLWVALAIEIARPQIFPHGSLLLPLTCGVMFWTRSTTGMMLSGTVLLLDWIARPSYLPLCPMILPFIAVTFLAPSRNVDEFDSRRLSFRIPLPLQLPLLTLAAVVLFQLGLVSLPQQNSMDTLLPEFLSGLKALAIIAFPVSAILTLLIRIADEFGMRRSFS